jgi:hypothetical protein
MEKTVVRYAAPTPIVGEWCWGLLPLGVCAAFAVLVGILWLGGIFAAPARASEFDYFTTTAAQDEAAKALAEASFVRDGVFYLVSDDGQLIGEATVTSTPGGGRGVAVRWLEVIAGKEPKVSFRSYAFFTADTAKKSFTLRAERRASTDTLFVTGVSTLRTVKAVDGRVEAETDLNVVPTCPKALKAFDAETAPPPMTK